RQRLGERIEAAARREVREEAGIEIAVGPLVDVVDSITRDDNGAVQYHYTLVDLLAEWRAGEAVAGHDAAEVAWADPADLAPFDLWAETERIIALAMQKRAAS
ncbi:MAG TPA: NUDIX domain-containing protein, partial [Kiloniellaceae bacterium]|nr:NUDIX domain-containing protein [Kiloniellaceae bacterium]